MRFGEVSAIAALFVLSAGTASAAPLGLPPDPGPDRRVAERFVKVTRATKWSLAKSIRIRFRTFHPQGMVRIGENFYLSSVEVRTPTRTYVTPQNGLDRTAGSGVAHLFKVGPDGRLLGHVVLGEGTIYHPGGIDFDGTSIWVPVSEYRPNSRAIVYRVDPRTMTATEAFRFADHIGGIVRDTADDVLYGLSWGSRTFYAWPLGADGNVAAVGPEVPGTANPSHYVDYQDCHHVGGHRMLCGGVSAYRSPLGVLPFQLGGIDLVDLRDQRPVWQVPVELRSRLGRPITQNPVFVEANGVGLRGYFLPDDDISTLFVYDILVK